MPSMAAARLSAGSLAEMQSHIFWLEVTRHSFMKSSARAAPARLVPRTQTTRLKHIALIDLLPESPPLPAAPTRQYRGHVRRFKGLGWTHLSKVSLLVDAPAQRTSNRTGARLFAQFRNAR